MASSVSPRTYPLGIGTLAIGTSGYIVTGLLPAMSARLHASPAIAGQLLTVFAISGALSGPAIAIATRHWERRRLLVAALTVASLGNALAATAWNVTTLIIARIVTALGTAVYTAAAAAVASHINEPHNRPRAMSVVFGGLTLALLLGVPASNALSRPVGYQGVFWLVAVLCALIAATIVMTVPTVSPPTAPSRRRLDTATRTGVLAVLGTALLACTSNFTVYTYIAVIIAKTPGVHGGTTSALLAAYGIGATIGNALGGRITSTYGPRCTLIAATGTCAILLLIFPIATTTAATATATLLVWGCASWSINPPLTSWLVQQAPAQTNLLLPALGSIFYLGMGLGALLGGLVIASLGLTIVAPAAGVLSILACSVLLTRPMRGTSLHVVGDATNETRGNGNCAPNSERDVPVPVGLSADTRTQLGRDQLGAK